MLQEIITYFICFTAFSYAGYSMVTLFYGKGRKKKKAEKPHSVCASCEAVCIMRNLAQKNGTGYPSPGNAGKMRSQDEVLRQVE